MWFEPRTEVEKRHMREKGLRELRLVCCYRCGTGGFAHQTLYRVGRSPEGETVYGCAAHRGLRPQADA